MKVIYWPKQNDEDEFPTGCVATIGVFDGVHSGHRRLLFELVSEAEKINAEAVVVTFDRSVQEVVGDGSNPGFITSLEHRLKIFAKLGIDVTVIMQFTPQIASLSAKEFANRLFKTDMKVKRVLLGFDGCFGQDKRGGVELCRDMGIHARTIPPVRIGGEIVSSTAIRTALKEGDLVRTSHLLGRPYSIVGKVVHGDSMGTDIGFPTANLQPENELLPKEGVYAGRACIEEDIYDAAISVGKRTTVHGLDADKVVVEIYIIDAKLDLYGKELEVQFFEVIREQKNFAKIDDLAKQISKDVEKAKKMLNTRLH